LGAESPTLQKGGSLDAVFNDVMEVATAVLRQFSRVAHVSLMGRHRILLEELELKEDLIKKVKDLPVDPNGHLLFGNREVDGQVESVSNVITGFNA